MLNSVLLYLEDACQAAPVIRIGVGLAKIAQARVRGVTLIDTRSQDAAYANESAVYAISVNSSHVMAEHHHSRARVDLSNACLQAGLNFDVRKFAGDPVEVLSKEGRFHDLVVTAGYVGTSNDGLNASDLAKLVGRGVPPVLVLHPAQETIERILLVYDGSEASGRAIKSYLNLNLLRHADYRLLAVGNAAYSAHAALGEMADYCRMRCPSLETGWVVGKARDLLPAYVAKWQADLVVVGMERTNALWRWIFGDKPFELLPKSSCSIFASC